MNWVSRPTSSSPTNSENWCRRISKSRANSQPASARSHSSMDTRSTPRKSFADVDYTEALRRAQALIPLLKREADASEKLTKITPAVLDAFHGSGLLRYMQPKRWGGMELDFVAVFDIPEMLGRG